MEKLTRVLFYALNIMVAAFAIEPSCPVCSRYDYEERILERVLSNELDMKHMLKEIRETNAEVKAALKVMQEDKTDLATAMTAMKMAQADMKSMLDDAIQGGLLNISKAVSAMTTNTSGAIQHMEKESKRLKDKLDDAVQDGMFNISKAVSAMTTNTSGAITQMEKENKILKDQLVIPTIYFYARIPASLSASEGQTVVYTAVEFNEGQGYDPANGRFTVSVPGLYVFAVQYCIFPGKDVWIGIVNQKKTLQRASFHERNSVYPCVSMQVFIKAEVSDQIWVKLTYSTSQLYTDSYRHNSFSGALVHL